MKLSQAGESATSARGRDACVRLVSGSLGGDIAFHGEGQLGEVSVADDLAELTLGFEHPGGGPAQAHVAVLPALDVARDAANGLDHRLAGVRRGNRALEP